MAFPALAAIGIGGALLGGIAGAQGNRSSGSSSSTTRSTVDLKNFDNINTGASGLENAAYQSQVQQFGDLSQLIGMGPGASAISENNAFQSQFGNQLQQLLNQAANPNDPTQIAQNAQTARALFAPQQERLNQQFTDMTTDANRLSARLGRAGNDPILRNKLFQEQSRQQRVLDAEVGSYGRQLPQITANNVMNIGGALSNLRQGLATQALQNRQTLLGLGNQLAQSERQYRLNTADRTNATSGTQSQQSGGGFSGFLSGALGGASAGLQVAQGFAGGGGQRGTFGGYGSAGQGYSNFSTTV